MFVICAEEGCDALDAHDERFRLFQRDLRTPGPLVDRNCDYADVRDLMELTAVAKRDGKATIPACVRALVFRIKAKVRCRIFELEVPGLVAIAATDCAFNQ